MRAAISIYVKQLKICSLCSVSNNLDKGIYNRWYGIAMVMMSDLLYTYLNETIYCRLYLLTYVVGL
jgi:hypothetical protein